MAALPFLLCSSFQYDVNCLLVEFTMIVIIKAVVVSLAWLQVVCGNTFSPASNLIAQNFVMIEVSFNKVSKN